MDTALNRRRLDAAFVVRTIGIAAFAYFFFGFMLMPCLNTLTSIFNVTNAAGSGIPGRSSASSSRATWAGMCGTP